VNPDSPSLRSSASVSHAAISRSLVRLPIASMPRSRIVRHCGGGAEFDVSGLSGSGASDARSAARASARASRSR
jgi:hypothetical protein